MPFKDNKKKLAYMKEYLASHREENSKRCRRWYTANKSEVLEKSSAYAKAHPDVNKAAAARYREKNREAIRARSREFNRNKRAENPEAANARARAYTKQRRDTDLNFRLRERLRARLQRKLRGGATKFASALDLTGCTTEFLRGYIESKFQPGMTWNNIHVDHIIPLASFDLTNEDEQRKAFHYQNLQPLFAKDNMAKGAKLL